MPFSSSAFAGSCPMLAGKLQSKIEAAKKLHDEGVKLILTEIMLNQKNF